MSNKLQISGLGAFGFVLMIFGCGMGAAIWMLYVINKAEFHTAILWGSIFAVPGAVLFFFEAAKAQDRANSSDDEGNS